VIDEQEPFIVMRWISESSVEDTGEPHDYIYEASGTLLDVAEEQDGRLAGKFRTYYVDVARAINEQMPIFDVFDTYGHTVDYHEAIFGKNSPEYSDRVTKLLGDAPFAFNVLILDRLELLPPYRKKGLGLNIMTHMMSRLGIGSGLIAIKPYPLQFEVKPSGNEEKGWREDLALTRFPKQKRIATKRLCDYYGKLGFRRLSSTPFMVKAFEN
jgi:GNAT superfamily N-acetyltransferase